MITGDVPAELEPTTSAEGTSETGITDEDRKILGLVTGVFGNADYHLMHGDTDYTVTKTDDEVIFTEHPKAS